MAKLVAIRVSSQLWQELVTKGSVIKAECTDGLPEGAELISSYYEGERATFYLVFYHDSFEDVPAGGKLPVITPIFSRPE